MEEAGESKENGTSSSSFVVIGENYTAGRRAIELNLHIDSKQHSSKASSCQERVITDDNTPSMLSKTPKFGKVLKPQKSKPGHPEPQQYFSNQNETITRKLELHLSEWLSESANHHPNKLPSIQSSESLAQRNRNFKRVMEDEEESKLNTISNFSSNQ